jgi:hypothetical protein
VGRGRAWARREVVDSERVKVLVDELEPELRERDQSLGARDVRRDQTGQGIAHEDGALVAVGTDHVRVDRLELELVLRQELVDLLAAVGLAYAR